MIKKLSLLILLFITAFSLMMIVQAKNISLAPRDVLYFSYCEKPIEYSVGSVDSHFNLTESELKRASQKAADLWNKAYGKPLFVYSATGELDINAVYDGRQSALVDINTLESDLDSEKGDLEAKLQAHAVKVDALERQVEDLNREVAEWNSKGGAPEDVYDELIRRRDRLDREIDQINEAARTLNVAAQTLNTGINSLNKGINEFNEVLVTHPEEGSYTSGIETIEIYLYDSEAALIHTLAHEFGHALRLEHTQAEDSIMYPIASPLTALSEEDILALKEMCRERSRIDEFLNLIKLYINSQ